MKRSKSELDQLRSGRTELENHYIDELVHGQSAAGSSCGAAARSACRHR